VCHNADGTGVDGLGKNLTISWFVASQDDGQLAAFITRGRAANEPLNTTKVPMPPKGGHEELTESDLGDIVTYVRGLQDPRRLPPLPAAVVAAPLPPTEAQKAEALGVYFWLDMEDSSYVDRTLELYRTLRSRHRRVGLAMQAYLRRTPQDLAALLPLQPTVRLVKGAYAEPAHVAFPAKRDTDLAYYDLAVELLNAAAKGNALPIFGTHDIGLLERITGKASALKVPDTGYEIHMLYGIRMAEQRALAARGRTVKTLISYGSSWFPWYMRRLAERPANVWFVVKSAFS